VSQAPYTFGEAKDAATRASAAQRATEDGIRSAYRTFAEADRAYRVALAQKILELRADGVAWSSTSDLARGDKDVARLKVQSLIAEGVKEAASQAGWRASKDRDDTAGLIAWSMRRELAENGVGA
jgi:hypothetical protein